MKFEEDAYFQAIIDSIQYDSNAFTVWYSNEKIVLGAILFDNLEAQQFFAYATIYNTIVDVDAKIKYSLQEAIKHIDEISFEMWKPLDPPSKDEAIATYYTENAIFRTEVL